MSKVTVTKYQLDIEDSRYSHIDFRGLEGRGWLTIPAKHKAVFESGPFDEFEKLHIHLLYSIGTLSLHPGSVDLYGLKQNPGLLEKAIGDASIFTGKIGGGSKMRSKLILNACGLKIRVTFS